MKIQNAIKKEILLSILSEKEMDECDWLDLSTDKGVETAYSAAENYEDIFSEHEIIDDAGEFRCSGEEVDIEGLTPGYSKHYEVDRVALKTKDGLYISWLYWHGGGKHGEPESIEWMREEDGACFVDCVETEELVTVRKYSKQ